MTMLRSTWALGALLACASWATAADWPMFRGAARTGISGEATAPLEWGPEKNIKWKSPLPGEGNSSPVVSGRAVFVTCATDRGRNRGLYCFDRGTGKLVWERVVRYDEVEPTHQTNPYCSSSPAADGRRVVVWHGSAGVFCYDYRGRQLWSRDLGTFRHIWGWAASPVLYKDRVILNCGPGARQFVIALNASTGKTLWQVDEPGGADDVYPMATSNRDKWIGSWATPVVASVDGRDQIIVSLPHHVQAYDPQSGKIIWRCEGLGTLAYTDTLVSDGVGVAMGGFSGPAIGFKLGGEGDVTESNRLWRVERGNPQRIGSGVILGEYIYMANEPGIAQCLELRTGEELWRQRLPGGKVWGSIIAVGDRLYVTNQEGTTLVFAADPEKFVLLAENRLDEPSNSTPAFADGQIFLRTFEHLYCIEAK